MLIITVVKSSLALSLGLVGALSIVRFRAAIKEPEELAYLFLTIAIGLGFGANQRVITIVAFVVIVLLIMLSTLSAPRERNKSVNLIVCSRNPGTAGLESIVRILQTHCREVDLRRFDTNSDKTEASFLVEVEGVASIESLKTDLHQLDGSMNITLLDSKLLGNFA
jgi:uncharacterized membrane protein YhiD involved in acid resistance